MYNYVYAWPGMRVWSGVIRELPPDHAYGKGRPTQYLPCIYTAIGMLLCLFQFYIHYALFKTYRSHLTIDSMMTPCHVPTKPETVAFVLYSARGRFRGHSYIRQVPGADQCESIYRVYVLNKYTGKFGLCVLSLSCYHNRSCRTFCSDLAW